MLRFLVLGLILLAAFVPLVAVSVETFAHEPQILSTSVIELAAADAPRVALVALTLFRAPPSR